MWLLRAESAADRRLRLAEDEIQAQAERIRRLEGAVGALARGESKREVASRPPAEGAAASLAAEAPAAAKKRVKRARDSRSRKYNKRDSSNRSSNNNDNCSNINNHSNNNNEQRRGGLAAIWGGESVPAGITALLMSAALLGAIAFRPGSDGGGGSPRAYDATRSGGRTIRRGASLRKLVAAAEERDAVGGIAGQGHPPPQRGGQDENRVTVRPVIPPRAQDCAWCPDGLAVAPDAPIPGAGGATCRKVADHAATLGGDLCWLLEAAREFCCPVPVAADAATAPAEASAVTSAASHRREEPGPSGGAVEDRPRKLFGAADDQGAARRGCVWCPGGLTVHPDTAIPGGDFTCGEVALGAAMLTGDLCAWAAADQAVCCPAHAAPAASGPSTAENSVTPAAAASLAPVQSCGFCPEGMEVAPDALVSGFDYTCAQAAAISKTAAAGDRLCTLMYFAQAFCCPERASPACEGADTDVCGCSIVDQADYRGTVSVTTSGRTCQAWSSQTPHSHVKAESTFPNAGLGNHNYCRNPDGEQGPGVRWEYCDVPLCEGSLPSSSPSLLSSALPVGEQCPVADNQACGCESARQSDYRGTIHVSEENGTECLPWDSNIVTQIGADGYAIKQLFPDSGFEQNYCRNVILEGEGLRERAFCFALAKSQDGDYEHYCNVPFCDPCSCLPECGEPNLAACGCPSFRQAESCCAAGPEGTRCKCGYLKEACRKSLENDSMDFCAIAEEACCEGDESPWCRCSMYTQICAEHPFKSTCHFAAESCCRRDFVGADSYIPREDALDSVIDTAIFNPVDDYDCNCQFFTYATDEVGYGRIDDRTRDAVCRAAEVQEKRALIVQNNSAKNSLRAIYVRLNGDQWFHKDGWTDLSSHYCDWHGVTCDNEEKVTEIKLSDNNLTGTIYPKDFVFHNLVKIDISKNKVSGQFYEMAGQFDPNGFKYLQVLEHLDLSSNEFSGHIDVLLFPSLKYVDVSNNKFTSAGFRRFHQSYNTLRELNLSSSLISQDVSQLFLNIPRTLESLDLSHNNIGGTLPKEFPLENVLFFVMSDTNIEGPLPDFPNASPKLKQIEMANNRLTGTVQDSFFKLGDLMVLDLSGNKLRGSIPDGIGDLTQLNTLKLSSNVLDGSIPDRLGKLKDVSKVFDVSSNKLTADIPEEISEFQGHILLGGNPDLTSPAPLDLCLLEDFDSVNDTRLCPPERTALSRFYKAAKGPEWTTDHRWMSQYHSHCEWFGVDCENEQVVNLTLNSNGLSGTLSKEISMLESLTRLDLSDNDMKGEIPVEIGQLNRLIELKLSHNSFVNKIPTEIQNLEGLELVHLHSNRLTGNLDLTHLNQGDYGRSSFVTDCGMPSYHEPVVCEGCTMCCNKDESCYPNEKPHLLEVNAPLFESYTLFCVVLLLISIGLCGILAMTSYIVDRDAGRHRTTMRRKSSIWRWDEKYAMENMGEGSVYSYFLHDSVTGWVIALATIASQVALLLPFLWAAEIDLKKVVDLKYTWECTRAGTECRDTSSVTPYGWFLFTILMATFPSKDLICGLKMVRHSGKRRHSNKLRARFFSGGFMLCCITMLIIYTSIVYNVSTATSDTELIYNAVIILFINEVDEKIFGLISTSNRQWIKNIKESNKYEENFLGATNHQVIRTMRVSNKYEENEFVKDKEKRNKTEENEQRKEEKYEEEKVEEIEEFADEEGRGRRYNKV